MNADGVGALASRGTTLGAANVGDSQGILLVLFSSDETSVAVCGCKHGIDSFTVWPIGTGESSGERHSGPATGCPSFATGIATLIDFRDHGN